MKKLKMKRIVSFMLAFLISATTVVGNSNIVLAGDLEETQESSTYQVLLEAVENGTYTYDDSRLVSSNGAIILSYQEGEEVEFTLTPIDTYELSSIHVFDSGNNEIDYSESENYTFTMPASDVVVKALLTENKVEIESKEDIEITKQEIEAETEEIMIPIETELEIESTVIETEELISTKDTLEDELNLENKRILTGDTNFIIPILGMSGFGLFRSMAYISVGDYAYYDSNGFGDGSGWATTYFYLVIDGQTNIAYCLEPSKATPVAGDYASVVIASNTAIALTLYYGYGGPGYNASNYLNQMGYSADQQYIITHVVAAYFNGEVNWAYGLNDAGVNACMSFANWVTTQPLVPDIGLSMSNSALTASISGTEQITDVTTLNGDSRNSITVTLQTGVTLHNVTRNTTEKGTVTIYGGDSFYLSAPMNITETQSSSWGSGSLLGAITHQYAPLAFATTSDAQMIGSYSYIYDPSHPVSFSVNWTEPIKGSVSITKIDSVTGANLTGAGFTIYPYDSSNGTYSTSGTALTYNSATDRYEIGSLTWTSANQGKFQIVETIVPNGYGKAWSQEFAITQNNQSFSYTASNKQVWAEVKLNKIDRESTLSDPQGDATLEGAVYEIYFDETVTHPDGTVYTKGDLAGTETTDINGELTFTDLLPYKYYIVEKTPSNGYLLDTTIYYVDCTHDGIATSISESVTVTEQIKKQAFEFIKISSDGSSGETELLEKAGFKVYLISDLTGVANGTITPSNGSYYTAADFATYDFTNENTAIDYSSGTAMNIAEIFTDSKGYAVSPELAYGSYVVVESTTPDGYVKINPFVVKITEDSRTPQVWRVFNDAEFEVYIKIVKKDATTGMTVLKAGAKYRILNMETGEYVEQWTTYPTKELWGTAANPYTTNDEGYLVTPQTIRGGNYEIIEVEAPSGYVLNGYEGILPNKYQSGDTTYTVSAQPSVKVSIQSNIAYLIDQEAGINYIELIQENNQQLGKLNLFKYGDKISNASTETTSKTDVSTEFSYSSVGIEGAQFKIYANSDIFTQDNQGTLLYSKGELVTTLTTDSKGQAYLNDLYIGKYRIEEVAAGNGFVLNTEVKYFEITAVDDEIAFCFVDKEYKNIRQKNKVVIQKLDIDTDIPLAGAVFGLYAAEDIKDYKGNVVIKKDALIETATSGTDGYANFGADFPLAEYYVKEIHAPEGYASTDVIVTLDGSYTTQTIAINTLTGIIKNKITEVQIIKKDNTTDVILSGADFALYECDTDGNMIEQDALYSWISDKNLDYIIKGLEVNKIYAIVEVNAPINYLQSEPFRFTVTDTGDVQYQEYKNDYVKGTFSITKEGEFVESYSNWIQNILDGFKSIFHYFFGKVESVTFELYAAEDIVHPDQESEDFFEAGRFIATITTDYRGVATLSEAIEGLPEYFEIGELPLGKYYVVEVDAADGFVLNNAPVYFELAYADQYTPIVTVIKTIQNLRQKVDIEVIKKDSETEEQLMGAIFELYAGADIHGYYIGEQGSTMEGDVIVEAGTIIERVITDKNGIASFKADLPLGLYQIREVKAPDGYILSDEIIEIDATYKGEEIEHIKLEFYNEQAQIEISKVELSSIASNMLTVDLGQLEGATLGIVDENTNELFVKWVTGEDMEIISKLVTDTVYILKELVTPAGNVTAADITFKMGKYGVLYILTDDEWMEQEANLVEMIDDITKIKVSKEDITNAKELPGAYLKIVDENGKVVEEWISGKEPHYIEKLPVGKYTLIETSAPSGFEVAENVDFEILDTGEVQQVVMYDSPIQKVPKTGDTNFDIVFLYSMLAIQALGVAAITYIRKEKRKGKKIK